MRKVLLKTACTAAMFLGVGCAGHHKKQVAEEPSGIKVHDDYYVANKSLKKFAAGESSPLEKKLFDANKAFGGRNTKFHTQNYAGTKSYSGLKDYKAKGFAQSDKKASGIEKAFSQADEKSKIGEKTFATKDSQYAGRTNRDAAKTFQGAGSEFRTKEDAIGSKAAKKNNQVVITGQDEPLTEDGVRRLLNKQ